MQHAFLAVAVVSTLACGTSNGPSEAKLLVAGTYQTTATMLTNNCGGVTIASLPTTVAHQPGAASFQLTHAVLTYAGTLQRAPGTANSVDFTTTSQVLNDGGETSTVTLAGSFSLTAIDFIATVDLVRATLPAGPPPPCRYTVRESGPKVGSPNVIP